MNNLYYAKYNPSCKMRAAPDGNEEGQNVQGIAMRFESPTVLFHADGIDYYEVIDRHALDECDMSDVVFDRGHAMEDKVLARTSNGTLALSVTEEGLAFKADVIDTQEGADTFKLIKRGDIHACSFAATIREDSYDQETHTRRILKIGKLYDVAAVTFPAYRDTEISAELRSKFMLDKGSTNKENFELQKSKMLLSL